MGIKEVEKIAEGMVAAAEKSGEKIAEGIVKSSENIANGIRDGFSGTAKEIGKALGGTRAELMLKILLSSNGGKIPDPESPEWKDAKEKTQKILQAFED